MVAYQAGDVASFEELIVRHERPLWGYLKRFVREAVVAEDLLQEVFLRVVRGADSWKPQHPVKVWIYAIARNLCIDHARRVQTRRASSLDAPVEGAADEGSGPVLLDRVADGSPHAEGEALDRELRDCLDRAIDALPNEQREVFVLRELMDLSFPDIATAVGASEATVRSRMRYAVEKLRQSMMEFHEASSPPPVVEPAQPSKVP